VRTEVFSEPVTSETEFSMPPSADVWQPLYGSFPRLTIHDLRHTAASLAISAGAHIIAAQRMLGHASAAMTLVPTRSSSKMT
jgi:integrase